MNEKKFKTGKVAFNETKENNPDCGSIVYAEENKMVQHFVDGVILDKEVIENEKKRLRERNQLFSQIEFLRKKREKFSDNDIERLFTLIEGLEDLIAKKILEKSE